MERPKHPIRNTVLAIVGLLLFGAILSLTLAFDNLGKLKEECQKPTASKEECITRMRAAGHADSLSGNYQEAEEWYLAAAKLDDRQSMFHLGWLNHALGVLPASEGRSMDVPKIRAAVEWYQKSADRGFAPAMNNLGVMKLTVPQYLNHREGVALIIKAARAYNPFATWTSLNYTQHMVNPSSNEKSGLWDATRASREDLSYPTLERTLYQLRPPSADIIKRAREAAEKKQSVLPPTKSETGYMEYGMKPVPVNPNMKTFREVQEDLRREQEDALRGQEGLQPHQEYMQREYGY